MIANPEALQQAFSLCQRYGIDVISTGSTIAFAMECFEKGLITKNDTDGVELNWGDHEAMIEMVRKIGEREGFGKLLGEGVRRAAERIGGIASEYALQMKGLEFPAHDPRISPTWSLRYATGSIGAAHMEPLQAEELEGIGILPGPCPELGYSTLLDRFEEKGKGIVVAKGQNLGTLLDSLTICFFLWQTAGVRQPAIYLDLLNNTTGLDMNVDEFLLAGERIFNLKRMFNVRRGISRKDDILPARFLTRRLEGGTQGYIPNLGLMLNEYYSFRGWGEEGIPTRECLSRLGLEECLQEAI
jgi:aldehyde:ferredoxin oxidoreductase